MRSTSCFKIKGDSVTKRLLLTILTLLFAACLVLSVILLPGAFLAIKAAVLPAPTVAPTVAPTAALQQPTLAPLPSATSAPAATLTPEAPPVGALPTEAPAEPTATLEAAVPPDIAAQMDAIEQQVIFLRGLKPQHDLKRNMLTKEQLHEKVVNDFFKDYTAEDAATDSRVLAAFGLLEPGFDLMNFYLDLYTEQVAGFYDSETKEFYVVQGESFGGPERLTYAHEFTHALQDQNYDLRDGLNLRDEYCQDHSQYCNAASALIEGDATMTSYSWFFQYGTELDKSQLQEYASSYQSPIYDSSPQYIQQNFLFPYQQGQEFVQSLFDRGGFSALAQVYADPPDSTEQILHPDQYPIDQPVELPQPDLSAALGSGWEQVDSDMLGEWTTYLVLAEGYQPDFRIPTDQARTAAAGWQGDSYSAYWNADAGQLALEQRWRWEKTQDTQEFWDALQTYANARWGRSLREGGGLVWANTPDGYVTISRSGNDVLWVIAPDADTAGRILEQLAAAEE